MVENKKLYKEALEKKGLVSQIDITIEECSELIQALIKYKRCNEKIYEKTILRDKIIEELVDATIMIEQMIVSFDCEGEFNDKKLFKINRLKNRLNALKKKNEL